MAHIIAGYLQKQIQVQDVINQLVAAGYAKEKISSFYVDPAGQHDLYPFGGNPDMSPGARKSVARLVIGVARSMSSSREKGESEEGADGNDNAMAQRKSGMMVAVSVSDPAQQASAVQILHSQGGQAIECAEGTISNGDWIDFDPLAPPVPVSLEVAQAVDLPDRTLSHVHARNTDMGDPDGAPLLH